MNALLVIGLALLVVAAAAALWLIAQGLRRLSADDLAFVAACAVFGGLLGLIMVWPG